MEHEGRKLLEQGEAFEMQGDYVKATAIYDRLFTQNQDNPWIMAKLGSMFLREPDRMGMAIHMLSNSVKKLNGKAPSEILSNLGLAYRNSGLIPEAIEYLEKATKHESPVAGAFTNYAGCFVEKGDPERVAFRSRTGTLDLRCSNAGAGKRAGKSTNTEPLRAGCARTGNWATFRSGMARPASESSSGASRASVTRSCSDRCCRTC